MRMRSGKWLKIQCYSLWVRDFQSFPNVVGPTVPTGKIVVGPTNYDLFPDQMSDVFRDRFHDFYFLSMRDYKE
jgi:hypothetical protein